MAELKINFRTEWLLFDTDLSRCSCCNETIYSKMRVFCITPFSGIKQWVTKKTDVKCCPSCFDLLIAE